MSTSPQTGEYVLFIRNSDWVNHYSPEEVLRLMGELEAWIDQLKSEGKFVAGYPLTNDRKIIAPTKVVTDGPFAESKEAIAGYIVIRASSLEKAVEIAKGAPCLDHDQPIEIRAIASEAEEYRVARDRAGKPVRGER
jgi:hypothetical protein